MLLISSAILPRSCPLTFASSSSRSPSEARASRNELLLLSPTQLHLHDTNAHCSQVTMADASSPPGGGHNGNGNGDGGNSRPAPVFAPSSGIGGGRGRGRGRGGHGGRGAFRSRLGGERAPDPIAQEPELIRRVLHDEYIMSGLPNKPADQIAAAYGQWCSNKPFNCTGCGARAAARKDPGPQGRPAFGAGCSPHPFIHATPPLGSSDSVGQTPVLDIEDRLAKYLVERNDGTPMPTSECSCRYCFGYECYLAVSHHPSDCLCQTTNKMAGLEGGHTRRSNEDSGVEESEQVGKGADARSDDGQW